LRCRRSAKGYSVVTQEEEHGKYALNTTLRYVTLRRNDVECETSLVNTRRENSDGTSSKSRPALAISFNESGEKAKYNLLAFHALSVTKSVKPQAEALATSLQTINDDKGLRMPSVIFGDLNVNASDEKDLDAFKKLVSTKSVKDENGQFKDLKLRAVCSEAVTRPKSQKKLDWALATPEYKVRVQVATTATSPYNSKRKAGPRAGSSNNPNKRIKEAVEKTREAKIDEELSESESSSIISDYSHGDDESKDPTYFPEVNSTVKSDHEAIFIDIGPRDDG
jgi:hypothetical protein